MVRKQREPAKCRVCGKIERLTEEHILPRAAGGNKTIKVFTGTEMLKTIKKDSGEKPYGVIKQSGHTEFTLCKSCNNHSGLVYDKDFADFYNTIAYKIAELVQDVKLEDNQTLDNYLLNQQILIELDGVKPMNVAKRVLVAFCSVEFAGLTDRSPEIRKAIMEKTYTPDTSQFSLYMTPHVGSSSYFATMASLSGLGTGKIVTQAFAGIEIGPLAFYFSKRDEHKKGGNLSKCIDVTNWLTDCSYDQKAHVKIGGKFLNPLMMNFPAPEWK
ncbi:MAG: hypothetical protein WBK76_01945 [Candidatus Saccharimonadales bacterium]